MAASDDFNYADMLSMDKAKLVKRSRLNFLGSKELILDYQLQTAGGKEEATEWLSDNRLTVTDPKFGFKTYSGTWKSIDIIFNEENNTIRQRFKIDSSLKGDVAQRSTAGDILKSYYWRIVNPAEYNIPEYYTDESAASPSVLDNLEWDKQTGTFNGEDFYYDSTDTYSLWFSSTLDSHVITIKADRVSPITTTQYFYNSDDTNPDGDYVAAEALLDGTVTLSVNQLIDTEDGGENEGTIFSKDGTYNGETSYKGAEYGLSRFLYLWYDTATTWGISYSYGDSYEGWRVSQNTSGLYGQYTEWSPGNFKTDMFIDPYAMGSASDDITKLNNIGWSYSGDRVAVSDEAVLYSSDGNYAFWTPTVGGLSRITATDDVDDVFAPALIGDDYIGTTYTFDTDFSGGVSVSIVDSTTLLSEHLTSATFGDVAWSDSGTVENDKVVYYDDSEVYALWFDESAYLITVIADVGTTPTDYFSSASLLGTYSGNGSWTGSLTVSDILDSGQTLTKSVNDNGDGTYDVIISRNNFDKITGSGRTVFGAVSSTDGRTNNVFISGATTYVDANGEYIYQGLLDTGDPDSHYWSKGDWHLKNGENATDRWDILEDTTVRYNKRTDTGLNSNKWRIDATVNEVESTFSIEIGRNGPALGERITTSINSEEIRFVSDGGTLADPESGEIKTVSNIPLSNGLFKTTISSKTSYSQRVPALYDMFSYCSEDSDPGGNSTQNGIVVGKNRTLAELTADMNILNNVSSTILTSAWSTNKNSVSISLNNYGRYDYSIMSRYPGA